MSDKIRLTNTTKFDIGIVLPDKPLGMNIKPGSFTLVTQDDVDYLMSMCDLLQRGFLQVDEAHKAEVLGQMGIVEEDSVAFMTDEDIEKKLNGTVKKLQEWLNDIDDNIMLGRIADIACGMDSLSASKLKILQSKMPERDFLN